MGCLQAHQTIDLFSQGALVANGKKLRNLGTPENKRQGISDAWKE